MDGQRLIFLRVTVNGRSRCVPSMHDFDANRHIVYPLKLGEKYVSCDDATDAYVRFAELNAQENNGKWHNALHRKAFPRSAILRKT